MDITRDRVIRHLSPVTLSLLLLLTACTSTQPVAKLGLIAPFEGLYRRSGYEALAAMRAALADHPTPGLGVLPVALDDSGDPVLAQRAMAKLLVDPAVAAVVGPLTPPVSAAVAAQMQAATVPWLQPFRPGATPTDAGWAIGLVARVAELAASQGARTLVLAGWTPGWPTLTPEEWTQQAGLPVRMSDAPQEVQPDEAIFWLGSPDAGAAYLRALRTHRPEVPFWLGPQGGDPVFAERAGMVEQVYWVIWTTPGYNAWSTTHTPSSPTAYLVYRATVDAIDRLRGETTALEEDWYVQAYALGRNGVSRRYPPMP